MYAPKAMYANPTVNSQSKFTVGGFAYATHRASPEIDLAELTFIIIITVLQVWQAIEKVLLEDSLCQNGSNSNGSDDAPQFTELAPVPQLHIPETNQDPSSVFIHPPQALETSKVRRVYYRGTTQPPAQTS